MSDHEKSGEPVSGNPDLPAPAPAAAPVNAETPPAENTGNAATPSAAPAVGSFGTMRGSGLARGKRTTTHAAGNASTAGYKPTSIEVIAVQTEYKNPFTGETTVTVPRANEPVPQAAPAPAPMPALVVAEAPAPATPVASPVPESSASLDAALTDEKPELKILPPEEQKRNAVRWESPAGEAGAQPAPSNREERPTFRPDRERRDGRPGRENREGREGRDFGDSRENREPGENRDPRENREGRENRDPRENRAGRDFRGQREPRGDRSFEPRTNQPQPERRPEPAPQKKVGGFVGWLKGLFGGGAPEAPSGSNRGEPSRDRGDDQRRNRGGRDRGGYGGYQSENRGPRPEGQQGGGQGDDARGEGGFDGQRRRRRRRGGRGRHNSDPRPEGQQGGGAI